VAEVAGVPFKAATGAQNRPAEPRRRGQPPPAHRPPPAAGSPAEDALVAVFARAWESADLDALVALLTGDVFIAMPPEPFGYQGRDAVARYWARQFAAGRRFDLVSARANGQPAFRAYLPGPGQRPARVGRIPARPGRNPPRGRLLRAHPGRRPDPRHDPLRGQRAALVRATALTPQPKLAMRSSLPPRACT